jgi:hypothetical protein
MIFTGGPLAGDIFKLMNIKTNFTYTLGGRSGYFLLPGRAWINRI